MVFGVILTPPILESWRFLLPVLQACLMSPVPLIVHAPNIHQGGGRVLLLELLGGLPPETQGVCQLDARLPLSIELPAGMQVRRVAPRVPARWQAERFLAETADAQTRILCFGNLPPLRRCRGVVAVYVQNRHVVSRTSLKGFSWKQGLRIRMERYWFRHAARNAQHFLVQTESMKLALDALGLQHQTRVLPFAPADTLMPPVVPRASDTPQYDFCYVATGEQHKNHRLLIEAWILLAKAGRTPSLCLTVCPERDRVLAEWIDDRVRTHNLQVTNRGNLSRDEVHALYDSSRALVFPSRYESFGLPLLEARGHGLKLVTPELDYVRDVVTPDETFDVSSARSLARAVERCLDTAPPPPLVCNGSEFVTRLLRL
jgi:glycosyltransferase involved in cell wall biosynthesis